MSKREIEHKEAGLNIVVVGHVDHGKSTVIGRLLYDTDSLPQGAIDKVAKIAHDTGKPFEYAYLLDAFEEEQQQGITIDTTRIQFSTDKRDYVIIDAPGHKEFLKNMISGAAGAEAALLIVDGKQGVQEQSRRHAYMLSLLGIKKVYVLVNKMDLAGYAETAFVKIKHEMGAFLAELGVYPLKYIPVSGLQGDNIASHSEHMEWYKGETLLEALDLLEGEQAAVSKALRLPIQDVYKFDSRRIIAGRIEAGQLAVGDEIAIYPGGRKTKVVAFPYWQSKDKVEAASAGASTGIQVADEFFNQRGEIITKASDKPPLTGKRLRVSLFWLGKNSLKLNRRYKLKLGTQEVEAQVESIEKIIDASSLDQRAAETVKEIRLNDVAEVILKLKEEIAFDRFQDYQATGRFVLVDGYDVAGGGIVLGAEKEQQGEFSQKAMRYIMNHLPQNGELIVVVKDGEIVRLERTEREVFSGIDGEGI
ncbi:putative sulfate adenylyltransferase subunit 1 [Selenomonas ruminantium subsp. lactilytica TAM6421]|uniref:sulfate adenylyltransferase n=1 Tax=Selenomonas ruminantium subsp. lactilytica (strain NBRC 103574 / TAM6421) TaxID=927704 RepID=I0GUL2_SELRL|nr:GTP-binding protein [Selenomonas ruminantium]BAL84449.1 putative sulfate adenylyltransferase subunit 1 [Selenomonas ruminantium subsp. lactilytica TAM6421]